MMSWLWGSAPAATASVDGTAANSEAPNSIKYPPTTSNSIVATPNMMPVANHQQMLSTSSANVSPNGVGGGSFVYGQGRPHPSHPPPPPSSASGNGTFALTPSSAAGVYGGGINSVPIGATPTAAGFGSSTSQYPPPLPQQQQQQLYNSQRGGGGVAGFGSTPASSSYPSPTSAAGERAGSVGAAAGGFAPSLPPRAPTFGATPNTNNQVNHLQQQQQQQQQPQNPIIIATTNTIAAAAVDPSLPPLIDSLINFSPIPKFMEAAVIVGKVQLLLDSGEEGRLLAAKRVVDDLLEEAIEHRDERNRLLRIAAERDAIVDLCVKHKMISFTPSITEVRTPAIEGIASSVRRWVEVRGGLGQILSGVVAVPSPSGEQQQFQHSTVVVAALRQELLRAAALLEYEVGAVFDGSGGGSGVPDGNVNGYGGDATQVTSSSLVANAQPQAVVLPPVETLSFIFLSSLMVDISRATMTILTSYVRDDMGGGGGALPSFTVADDDLAAMLMMSADSGNDGSAKNNINNTTNNTAVAAAVVRSASSRNSLMSPSPTVIKVVDNAGGAISSSSSLMTPAKANKVFFKTNPKGIAIAAALRELVVMAKTVCGSGRVCEEVQTVCSIKLAELMSALDEAVAMDGVSRRRGGLRARSASNANHHSGSNASFASVAPTPVPTPTSGGGGHHHHYHHSGGGGGPLHGGGGASSARSVSPSHSCVSGGGYGAEYCEVSGLKMPLDPMAMGSGSSNGDGVGGAALLLNGSISGAAGGGGSGARPQQQRAHHHHSDSLPLDDGATSPAANDAHHHHDSFVLLAESAVAANPLLGALTGGVPVHPFVLKYLTQVVGKA